MTKKEKTTQYSKNFLTIKLGCYTLKLVLRHTWACGGMVDTLVLGTSAKAWEFESLHAHHLKKNP